MMTDLRYAWRAIRKSPATSLGAMLALGIGIGATTGVFGLLNAVILRPLPYPEPHRLVEIYGTVQREQVERRGASFADFFDWRDQARSFDGMAAWYSGAVVLRGAREAAPVQVEVISGPYFRLLGAQPLLGRVLDDSDKESGGGVRAAVINESLWDRHFNRAPDVVGRAIQVHDLMYTVVGVVPARFRGRSDDAEVWVTAAAALPPSQLESRGDRFFPVLARLAPGVTLASAQAEMDGISQNLERAYPDTNERRAAEVSLLAGEVFGDVRGVTGLLSGAVVLVLLIACANVASLLLARTEQRRRELSVRLALGADRRRLARLMLAESAWLVLLGGGAGWLLALWASDALLALSPVQLPSFAAPSVDWRMLLFASVLCMATTVGIGLVPLVTRTPSALAQDLRESAMGTRGTQRSRPLKAIVVGEVALAVSLLVGATLLGRSLTALVDFDPGYDAERVLALGLALPVSVAQEQDAPPPATGLASLQALEALRAVPGVTAAALATDAPLGGASAIFYAAEGQGPTDATNRPRSYVHRVTPGYFATVGLPLREGRDFLPAELTGDVTSVVVSESLARRFWPGASALGRRIKPGTIESDRPWWTIVGVVADANLRGIPRNPTADPDVYLPFSERAQSFAALLRTDGAPGALGPAAREALRRVDPQIAITTAETIEARVAEELAPVRFLSWLSGTFALLAFTLALIGIYAVLAHTVRRRAREIGIRTALGASRGAVVGLVVGQGMGLVAAGLAVGLILAVALSRMLETWLFGIGAVDPLSYALVAAACLGSAALASLVPAVRAARVDPMIALRND